MTIDDIKTVAVLGAGDMGHGIAEVALIAGYKVFLRDIEMAFVDNGIARIHASLAKLVDKGKVTAEHHEKIKTDLLIPCLDLAQAVEEADLVIEAIPEVMDLKKETFRSIDQAAPAHTFQRGPSGKRVLFGHEQIEGVPMPDCLRAAKQPTNIAVGEVQAFVQQRDVGLRFVPEKAGPPDPGPTLRDGFRHDDPALPPVHGKVVTIETVPG